jgi:hypothetical protein
MDIFKVFFWFCKEQKIMDIMFKMYNEKRPEKFEPYGSYGMHFEPISLKEFLTNRILTFGFTDIFWYFQPIDSTLTENPRYKKARSKWNAFSKNNIKFSDDFIKIGDSIEAENSFGEIMYKGTVIDLPKEFSGSFEIKNENGEESMVTILCCSTIKVNGVEKKPEFYIKRKRKIYGVNKG